MQIQVTIRLKMQETPQIRSTQLEKPCTRPVIAEISERTQKEPAMQTIEMIRLMTQIA